MTVVLNEHEWAEEMIRDRLLGKKPFETMLRVAKYYIDNGIPKSEVRKKLDTFLIQCDPTASLPKWSDLLDVVVTKATKYRAVIIKSIDITYPEMEQIKSLRGKQLQRLAFTLLCLAKYWDIVTQKSAHWVNNKDSDIMRMANIGTSVKRQGQLYHSLNELGMVQFSKKVDNTNVKICYVRDGDIAVRITDLRNLGYQYLMYLGEPYFECKNCGITTRYLNPKNGYSTNKQKYCKTCAAKLAMQQTINSVMRKRCSHV